MVHRFAILGILLVLAGCGESSSRRVVPVTPTRSAGGGEADADALTRPPRAIATH